MWLWSQHKPIIDNLPTEENRSDKERAKTANELVSEGDSLWEEGFKGLNDKTLLNDAYVYYKNAWKELTGEDWQYKNIKGNKDVKVLVEAVQSAVLKDKLIYRIDVLEKKLDGFSLW